MAAACKALLVQLEIVPCVSQDIFLKIPADIQKLLAEFPGILHSEDAPPVLTHSVEHVIKTSGRPIFAKARRLDSEKIGIAKN